MKVTAENLTDEQCQAVAELMPSAKVSNLIDGAIGMVEPHRNHSRHELAKLWIALACTACTLQYLGAPNHPTGCIFVGWGHGWQSCSSCGGSGLSPMGNDFNVRREGSK